MLGFYGIRTTYGYTNEIELLLLKGEKAKHFFNFNYTNFIQGHFKHAYNMIYVEYMYIYIVYC